jgi:hypothetical protein
MANKKVLPLTKAEVKKVILKFWELNAKKKHVADFIPIVDENFKIVLKEKGKEVISFIGLSGLQDHQDGKAPIFYNQKFVLKSMRIKITNNEGIAKTVSQWHCMECRPQMAFCKKLIANLKHTWVIKRSPITNRAVIALHSCDYFRYVPGFSPSKAKEEFHLTLK